MQSWPWARATHQACPRHAERLRRDKCDRLLGCASTDALANGLWLNLRVARRQVLQLMLTRLQGVEPPCPPVAQHHFGAKLYLAWRPCCEFPSIGALSQFCEGHHQPIKGRISLLTVTTFRAATVLGSAMTFHGDGEPSSVMAECGTTAFSAGHAVFSFLSPSFSIVCSRMTNF